MAWDGGLKKVWEILQAIIQICVMCQVSILLLLQESESLLQWWFLNTFRGTLMLFRSQTGLLNNLGHARKKIALTGSWILCRCSSPLMESQIVIRLQRIHGKCQRHAGRKATSYYNVIRILLLVVVNVGSNLRFSGLSERWYDTALESQAYWCIRWQVWMSLSGIGSLETSAAARRPYWYGVNSSRQHFKSAK